MLQILSAAEEREKQVVALEEELARRRRDLEHEHSSRLTEAEATVRRLQVAPPFHPPFSPHWRGAYSPSPSHFPPPCPSACSSSFGLVTPPLIQGPSPAASALLSACCNSVWVPRMTRDSLAVPVIVLAVPAQVRVAPPHCSVLCRAAVAEQHHPIKCCACQCSCCLSCLCLSPFWLCITIVAALHPNTAAVLYCVCLFWLCHHHHVVAYHCLQPLRNAILRCIICMLYHLQVVPSAGCTTCMLYHLHAVPLACCTICSLYHLHAVPLACCTSCMLGRQHTMWISTISAKRNGDMALSESSC